MATKVFAIRTEPHRAEIGDTTLLFVPEVNGAAYAEAYAELRNVQSKAKAIKASSTKPGKAADVTPESMKEISAALRSFVRRFLVEESLPVFDGLSLPDRIMSDLLQWTTELYGGGSGNGEAGGSSAAS